MKKANLDEEIAELKQYLLPTEQTPDLALRECGRWMPLLCLFALSVLLWLLGKQLIPFEPQRFSAPWSRELIGTSILLIFLPIAAYLLTLHLKNRLHPPLILSASGLKLRNWPHLLPWSHLERIGFDLPSPGLCCISLYFQPFPEPLNSEWCMGIRVFKKQSLVVINGNKLRLPGQETQATLIDLMQTLHHYKDNATARKRLAELGVSLDD